MDSAAFYAAARERLAAVTDDADALAALDRMAETAARGDDELTNAALGAFLADAQRLDLSLDFVFCGEGEPFAAGAALARFLGSLVCLSKQDQRDVAHVLERMANASDTQEGEVMRQAAQETGNARLIHVAERMAGRAA